MQDQAETSTPRLLSVRQAAEMLGVSTDTVRRYIKNDKLTSVRIQPYNHPRVKLTDVLALIQQGAAK